MAGSQRAGEVQPVRTGQDAGHNLGVIVPAACAVTAVVAGPVSVVLAQRVRDAATADAPSPARPVEQVSPVQPGQPCRDLPASRPGFPARELVQAAQRAADVRIGDEPVLGVRCRAVVVGPDAGRRGRLTGKHGEPFPGRCRGPCERGVKGLLHFRSRSHVGLLVPARDRADADPQMRGERLVAHPKRGLQGARGASGPAGHQVHGPPTVDKTEMTALKSRPAQAPGTSGRAQARATLSRTPAGFTAIGVLPVPLVTRHGPRAARPVSPHYGITRAAAPRGSRKPLTGNFSGFGATKVPRP